MIYTDASKRQLGAVITQDNRPLAFFGIKLNGAQQKYNITELELLSIVDTLKEFKGMVFSQEIEIYTDHINRTRETLGLTSDCVFRWRLIIANRRVWPKNYVYQGHRQYCRRCY